MTEYRLYQEDISYAAALDLPWEMLKNKTVLITGARGLLGSCLIDVLMIRNVKYGMNCRILALGRDEKEARDRFAEYWDRSDFQFVKHDMNQRLDSIFHGPIHYILHFASNTHPMAYARDPIGTITTNIVGLDYLLEFAVSHGTERFVFASSNEIYGENRGDCEVFDEKYCGYIDCNTMRAGYPESKRCGEALCQAYRSQKNLNVVIPRFTRSYGPTMLLSDTKALSQFIEKGIQGEDIVLKSDGSQYYSYLYAVDAIAGLLYVWLRGENGEAYNISDQESDVYLKDLAGMIAEIAGTKVRFEIPDEIERSGYSTATKARLDSGKLKKLGFCARYSIREGLERTIQVLREKMESGRV